MSFSRMSSSTTMLPLMISRKWCLFLSARQVYSKLLFPKTRCKSNNNNSPHSSHVHFHTTTKIDAPSRNKKKHSVDFHIASFQCSLLKTSGRCRKTSTTTTNPFFLTTTLKCQFCYIRCFTANNFLDMILLPCLSSLIIFSLLLD